MGAVTVTVATTVENAVNKGNRETHHAAIERNHLWQMFPSPVDLAETSGQAEMNTRAMGTTGEAPHLRHHHSMPLNQLLNRQWTKIVDMTAEITATHEIEILKETVEIIEIGTGVTIGETEGMETEAGV